MEYYYREARPEDLPYLSQNIRDIDRQEAEAVSRVSLEESLEVNLARGGCLVVIVGDKPEAIFGCVKVDTVGVPWFLASEKAFHDKAHFMKTAHKIVAGWQEEHCLLANYVHEDNKKAKRWLRALGFTFLEQAYFSGQPFRAFVRLRKDV